MHRILPFIPKGYRYFVLEYGALVACMSILSAACVVFFIYYNPSPVMKRDYRWAKVLATMDTSSKHRMTVDATIQLPDDATGQIRARGFDQAQWLLEPVCVAKLTRENGRVSYRLEPIRRCSKQPQTALF